MTLEQKLDSSRGKTNQSKYAYESGQSPPKISLIMFLHLTLNQNFLFIIFHLYGNDNFLQLMRISLEIDFST